MKLGDIKLLTELPDYDPRQLPPKPNLLTNYFSDATLARDFKQIAKLERGVEVWMINDNSMAVIGDRRARPPANETEGLHAVCTLLMKPEEYMTPGLGQIKTMLQVDYVEADPQLASRGYGRNLYQSVVAAGFMLACDNYQYFHGRKLWESLVQGQGHTYVINILKDGKMVLDNNGQLLNYDGRNFPADEIWTEVDHTLPASKRDTKNHNTILIMRRK